VLKVKTGEDGKMFGSITSGSIADELKQQFEITLDKKKIHLEQPLRGMGNHEIELRLHPEVTATLNVRIESTNPAAQQPEAPAPEQKAAEPAADRRREKGRPVRRPRAEKSAGH
jgi:large subunit ribosomal protein L9